MTTDPAFPSAGLRSATDARQFDRDGMSMRQYYKGQILAGFCANPAIFAANSKSGWSLVNCTEADLLGYA